MHSMLFTLLSPLALDFILGFAGFGGCGLAAVDGRRAILLLFKYQIPPSILQCVRGCMHRYLASSMVAGLMVTTAMNPLDVISTRLYTQGTSVTERYTGPLDCATKTVRAEGFRGVSGPSEEVKPK